MLPALVGVAVVATIFGLVSGHFDIRNWIEFVILYFLLTGGFSLIRNLRTRRRAANRPDKG
jgi:uncharacterized membrane protein